MDQLLISIIMPVYNAENYIKDSINSILEQTYPFFELLILDDCSTDNTLKVLNTIKDTRITIYKNDQNQGYLKSCNKLMSLTHGDIITFQDADDISMPNRLNEIFETFKANGIIDFITSDSMLFNHDFSILLDHRKNFDPERFSKDYKYQPYITGATIAITKTLYKNIGGYSLFFDRLGGEDYEWLFRMSQKYIGKNINKPLYNYRIHQSAVKSTNTNILKYIVHDLIQLARKEQIQNQRDIFHSENEYYLKKIVEKLEKPFKGDITKIIKLESFALLNNKKYNEAINYGIKAIGMKPLFLKNYLHLINLLYIIFRRKINI